MRRLLLSLLLSAASFAICLLVLEAALRIAGFAPLADLAAGRATIVRKSPDPILGYELTPGASGFAWQTNVEINAYGTRDRTHPIERSGSYRILVLGDSVTFGHGMAEEQRFTNLLEAELSTASRPVEILNFGVGGYDTLQEVVFLEHRGLQFSPDLVLLAYCMNDVGDDSPNRRYIRRLEGLDSPLYRLRVAQLVRTQLDRVHLARSLSLANEEERYRERNRGRIAPLGDDQHLSDLRGRLQRQIEGGESDFRLPWYLSDAHLGRLEYALARLEELSRDPGFRVVVSILPVFSEGAGYATAYEIVEHMASRHGFEVIPLHPILEGRDPRALRLRERDTIHPNAEAHRLIAEALAERLDLSPVAARSVPAR